MFHDLALWAMSLGAFFAFGGLLVDRTNIGAGLASGVKGRPYEPNET